MYSSMGSIEPTQSTRAGKDLSRYFHKNSIEEAEVQYANWCSGPEILPYVKGKPAVRGHSHAKN